MTETLQSLVDDLSAQRRIVTVYAADPPADLAERLSDWHADVRFDRLPPESGAGFVTVRQGDRFLGTVPLETVATLFEPTAGVFDAASTETGSLDPLLELLDDTLFQSFERRQLLAATHEIEDRAWRHGQGASRWLPAPGRTGRPASRLRTTRGKWPRRTRLRRRGVGRPPIAGVTEHSESDGELGQFWFVAFQPDAAARSQTCALLARERDPATYGGF